MIDSAENSIIVFVLSDEKPLRMYRLYPVPTSVSA